MVSRFMYLGDGMMTLRGGKELYYISVCDLAYTYCFKLFIPDDSTDLFDNLEVGEYIDNFVGFRYDYEKRNYVPCFIKS